MGQKYMKLKYTKLAYKFIKLKSNGKKIFIQLFLPISDCGY
jgi:hypothetical protein